MHTGQEISLSLSLSHTHAHTDMAFILDQEARVNRFDMIETGRKRNRKKIPKVSIVEYGTLPPSTGSRYKLQVHASYSLFYYKLVS